jgi:hypothetical protein
LVLSAVALLALAHSLHTPFESGRG